MKCMICHRGFKDNEPVLAVGRYTVNERRGDFVGRDVAEYIHLSHVAEKAAVGGGR